MEYTQVSFTITPNTEIVRDILMAELAQFEYDSFEETEAGLNAYIPTSQYSLSDVKNIYIVNSDEFKIDIQTEVIPDQNWNKTWETHYFQPIVIGEKCVIHSPFHTDIPKAEYDILIEPKMAFGTGHHETTGLMVKHILETDFINKSVLDMGCGTGILGILTSMRGAEKVLGIDIEEWAYNNTINNMKLNHINNMEVLCGDASLLTKEKYDVILANINRNILLEDIKNYAAVLKSGGTLILSGFYQTDLDVIDAECNNNNLSKISIKEQNNWVGVAYTHTN
ncbi:50S ribosomal protein L11 methyltransferase [Labilibacter sediminis]|nr:50S ribosomal protein L11 methyltransferase [Labilibacter sediminis]